VPDNREAITELVPEAIDRIAQIMRTPRRNAIAQLNACKIILDRGGLPPIQDVKISGGDSAVTLRILYDDARDKALDSPPAR
jgi:hypothetical protein